MEPDTLVWAIAALAEGLGIRAVARVLETDPPTVWGGLGEAADPREAFARHVLRDLDVEPGQLDARCAVRSAVKAGEGSARPAITCLSRSPHGVWGALDPVGSGAWQAMAGRAPWPWRNAWGLRALRCGPPTVPRCF